MKRAFCLSFLLSLSIAAPALLIGALGLILGIRSMMENGAAPETAPTLMIIVPLVTVLGILTLRQGHGVGVHFGGHAEAGANLVYLTQLVSVQVLFLLFGLLILAKQGYAGRFLFGRENSAGSYALVCPGVGFAVMVQFWINNGMVGAGLVEKFGLAYWALSAVALASQFAMVWLVFHLNRRHFGRPAQVAAVPAE